MIVAVSLGMWAALGATCGDPYCRTRVDTGIASDPNASCLYWAYPKVRFAQSQPGNPATGPSAFQAVSAAWGSWRAAADACPSSLTITEDPQSTSRKVGYDEAAARNENLVLFRQATCAGTVPASDPCWNTRDCDNRYDCWEHSAGTIALTTTTYSVSTGMIFDADIELNGVGYTFTTVDGPPCFPSAQNQNCVGTDIQNTVTHEAGHALGLEHNSAGGSTMFNSAPVGEISKRTLDPGSKRFICDTYPVGLLSRNCINLAKAGSGCSAAAGPAGLFELLTLAALVRQGRGRRRL